MSSSTESASVHKSRKMAETDRKSVISAIFRMSPEQFSQVKNGFRRMESIVDKLHLTKNQYDDIRENLADISVLLAD